MNRRLWGSVSFAVLGALASYGVIRFVQQSAPVAVRPSQESETSAIRTGAPSSSFVDARLAVFERVVALEDPSAIEQAILRAARSAPSAARDVELEALLLRYVEMDSTRAIRFATAQALEARFVATMFQALASRDPEAALAALAEVADAGLRRSIASALVDVLQSPEAIERLASIAGQGNPRGFVVTALQRLASLDPLGAIRAAERLPDASLRAETFERVARQWAFLDAPAALSYVPQIEVPSLRNRFHAAVVSAWIMADPDAALAYLQSPEGGRLLAVVPYYRSENLLNTIAFRLSIDGPERLRALAEGFAGTDSYAGTSFSAMAVSRAFEENWPEELARLETMPFGAEFQALALRVASEYARADPVAAVAWAKALDPPSVAKAAIERIVLQIGYSDPFAALDVALANDVQFQFGTAQAAGFSPEDFAAMADRLFAGGSTQQTSLEALMEYWPRRDPDGQWAWLLSHGDAVDAGIVKNTASAFAYIGHVLPAQTIYRLPEALREHWVVGFASEYARREPDAGLRWLRELAGDPEYERWATAISHNLLVTVEATRADPSLALGASVFARPAAEIIATMRAPPPDLVVATATFWARTEPMEVARWAARLPDDEARNFAIVAGIGGWTVNDPAGARRFALGLPPGATRDRALLTQLVQEISSHGSASPAVVSAIGTADEFAAVLRENSSAVTRAFRMLGTRDPVAATALLDRYVADPEMKAAVQAAIEAARLGGFSFPRELVYLPP